ncbi:MAG: cob(I)yrinic acid a,c-diamide adenosyltransferase [Bacteroidia bacterium]|nr:cob(I)yrinic acid a,c-diamide adenosyltransferase [Bacteroidia bacterium]
MKIYTKKGDKGTTSLIGGTRVAKHHLRIEAYGTVDELNSWIGMVRDIPSSDSYVPLFQQIQNTLFTIGSHLASDPGKSHMKLPEVQESDIEVLETSIDEMEATLPPLQTFILPGGHPANSMVHVARTVARRAERRIVELHEQQPVEEIILRYLNRLSDFLFVFARKTTRLNMAEEIPWKP